MLESYCMSMGDVYRHHLSRYCADGRIVSCVKRNRGYRYPQLGTLFRLSFGRMDFSVGPELYVTTAVFERLQNVKS